MSKTKMWQVWRWWSNGDNAREAFGWVRDTKTGKAMDQIDDIFQPAANDIRSWRVIQDIGKFSDDTIKEFHEAWAVVPEVVKKKIIKLLKKLSNLVDPITLVQLMEVYLRNSKRLNSL